MDTRNAASFRGPGKPAEKFGRVIGKKREHFPDRGSAHWERELRQLMGLFRATIQHRRNVRLLISGVAPFDEWNDIWSDYFISVQEIRIGHFDRDTSIELLTRPTPDFPRDAISLELAEKIFERTGGLPHLLQLYGSVLINLLNNEGKKRKHASMSDFDAVEETVLEKGGNYFNYIVKNAPQAAREILMGLSRGGQVQLRDIKPKTRRWLAHRCLITDDGQLTIPVLARWIREEWE